MSPARHARIKRIFLGACAAPAEQRDAALAALCAGEAELRGDVEVLLGWHERETPRRAAPPTFAAGRVIGQRYGIVAELGRGGMGAVSRADNLPGRATLRQVRRQDRIPPTKRLARSENQAAIMPKTCRQTPYWTLP
jgi:hypothetical protein